MYVFDRLEGERKMIEVREEGNGVPNDWVDNTTYFF